MAFVKRPSSIDLGDTPIENIFIDVYMPMANGTFVKVYLLAYKYACDNDVNLETSNSSLAKNLNIPLSDVLDAWNFWEEKKIIKKHIPPDCEDETNYTVEFLSLKQLYIDNNFTTAYNSQDTVSEDSYACSTKELLEANSVPLVKEMFNKINEVISRQLVPNEKMQILEWFHTYNADPPLIIEVFSYSRYKKNVRNIKYVEAVLRNWYDSGITTVEALQEYLFKKGEKFAIYNRIFKAMGFSTREPTEKEIEIMNEWIDKYNFSLDIILKACENSSKTPKPNLNYIHSILSDWYKKDVKTIDDIYKLDELFKAKKATSSPQNRPTQKIKTKFHLSESRGDKYTAKELEDLILSNHR